MKRILVGALCMINCVIASAQTADEIVAKYVAAIGGKDNIDKIKNVVMEGGMTAQGNTINLTVTKVEGKLFRTDMAVMGMNGYTLISDKEGWTFMPFLGQTKAEAMSADQVKVSQPNLDIIGPLYYVQSKGIKLELSGEEDISGSKCYVLKSTDSAVGPTTFYVDKTSYLLSRIKQTQEMMGQKVEVNVDFTDYKDVEGVKMPFSLTQQFGTVAFSSIKPNTTIAEKLYKPE